jgi:hypothetical protein
MTEPTTTDWDPQQDLAKLLDGLTDELLGAPDHEVTPYLSDAGDDLNDAAEAVRRLVAAADADFVVPPVSGFVAPGLRAFVTRNQ